MLERWNNRFIIWLYRSIY